jgi:hypothetical protein
VKLTTDYLWQKKLELERDQAADGRRRVFMVTPEKVTAEVPAYRQFLQTQINKYGRHHPIVASEYFLEPIDGTGGLFDARRRALMRGSHPRLQAPQTGHIYAATLDLAGEDEGTTDPVAQLANPARDYTLGTIFEVVYPPPGVYSPGPTYNAVDVFVDHGSKHFQEAPGPPCGAGEAPGPRGGPGEHAGSAPLVHRLKAWLDLWTVGHLVADESGVGLGVVSWLKAALGSHMVTGYNFAGAHAKAALGSMFVALIETGRFHYWSPPAPCAALHSLRSQGRPHCGPGASPAPHCGPGASPASHRSRQIRDLAPPTGAPTSCRNGASPPRPLGEV